MYEVHLPDGFTVSDDRARLDLDLLHRYLRDESYWARGRSRTIVERCVANSLCFGLYAADGSLAGFARVVSDRAVIAHLNDVFVLPPWRGRGLGKALVAAALAHPELRTVVRWTLSTSDAHGLYSPFGFGPLRNPETAMVRIVPEQSPETS